MYIPLFLVAAICGLAYIYLSWKISRAAIRSIAESRPIQMAGSKRTYLVSTVGLSFIGALALYLGLISLAGAPVQSFCVVTVLVAALIMGTSSAYGLRYIKFKDDNT